MSEKNDGLDTQPAPTPNDGTPVWDAVIEDMKKRDALGRKRYGTPLQTHNGRKALRDAYEEVLDLAVYLKQELLEQHATRVFTIHVEPENAEACRALLEKVRNEAHPLVIDSVPRRDDLNRQTTAEIAIYQAMLQVERAGSSVLLTEAIAHLQKAFTAVADHVDGTNSTDYSDNIPSAKDI